LSSKLSELRLSCYGREHSFHVIAEFPRYPRNACAVSFSHPVFRRWRSPVMRAERPAGGGFLWFLQAPKTCQHRFPHVAWFWTPRPSKGQLFLLAFPFYPVFFYSKRLLEDGFPWCWSVASASPPVTRAASVFFWSRSVL